MRTIEVAQGAAQTTINLQQLKPGVYKIVWNEGTKSVTQTVLVQ